MRKTFGTGSVWEQKLGYSRAVQVDNTLYISATSASGENGIVGQRLLADQVHPAEAGDRPGRRRVRARRRRAVQAVPDGHQQVGGRRPRARRGLRRDPPHAVAGPRAAVPGPGRCLWRSNSSRRRAPASRARGANHLPRELAENARKFRFCGHYLPVRAGWMATDAGRP
jgi:hypothetical protein